jgi:hypothetical protein
MRTQFVLVAAVSLALAGMVVGMSGIGGVFGTAGKPTISSSEALNDSLEDRVPSAEGGVSGSNDGELTQFITNGLDGLVDLITFPLSAPNDLIELGLPAYWAVPIGQGIRLLTVMGFAFLAMNRRFR